MVIRRGPFNLLLTIGLAGGLAWVATALGLILLQQATWAAPPTLEIDIERDITLNGIDGTPYPETPDQSGTSVAIGDINNDGIDDVIIGANGADPPGKLNAGETYVVFGPLSAGTIELSAADITIYGIDGRDHSGVGVGSGDINNDGVDDLIIGASSAAPDGKVDAGEAYVIFGPLTGTPSVIDLATSPPHITVKGISSMGKDHGDNLGDSVGSGDINNDGKDDLIIGASHADPGGKDNAGETYVLFGPLTGTPSVIDLATSPPNITIGGIDAGDVSGAGVAGGDINGDANADLMIGAPGADPAGLSFAGETYVLFGPLTGTPSVIDLATSPPDITVRGIDFEDSAGHVGSGDINNDGAVDTIIGANTADPGGRLSAGETYVVFGPLLAGIYELSAETDITYNGIAFNDQLGTEVATGDINNDGAVDIIIGAPGVDPPGEPNSAGATYVIFGELPPNAAPAVEPDQPMVTVDEGQTAANTGTVSDPDGDPVTLTATIGTVTNNNDGTWSWSYPTTDGPIESQTVVITADDGMVTVPVEFILSINNVAPSISTIMVSTDPIDINGQSSFSGDVFFTDPAGANDEPYTCDFDMDSDTTVDVTVTGVTGTSCSNTLNYSEPGVYSVTATVTDKDGGVSDPVTATAFIVVYSPSGGFVTGGGWIDSPADACSVFCGGATGKANFGFVSKYKIGATVPTGQTEFNFKAGGLNFHSSSYDWLVIAGAKAMYKGTGTINGAGSYTFQLNAIDGEITGGGGVDKFRIKIKDAGDGVIYDNQQGADDNDDPTTALGGGSIKIHKAK